MKNRSIDFSGLAGLVIAALCGITYVDPVLGVMCAVGAGSGLLVIFKYL